MKLRLILLLMITFTDVSYSWPTWMLNQDQKAFLAWQRQDYKTAANLFLNPAWRAVSAYKEGFYEKAKQLIETANNPIDLYNLGNIYAKQGDYKKALNIYKAVLKQTPNDADAKFNYKLMQKLLKQQQNNTQDQPQEKQQSHQDQQEQDQQAQQKEDQQAKQQWLKLVPDDIHGILRQQLWRDHLLKNQMGNGDE
jgi:Ca-activated chloride channel family protein